MISVALIGITSLVCDPSWVSNALEQAERLVSHTRAKKVLKSWGLVARFDKYLTEILRVKEKTSAGVLSLRKLSTGIYD